MVHGERSDETNDTFTNDDGPCTSVWFGQADSKASEEEKPDVVGIIGRCNTIDDSGHVVCNLSAMTIDKLDKPITLARRS